MKNELVAKEAVSGMTDANFPKDAEGRVYHLGVKTGDVANRILMVGDPERAKLLVTFLTELQFEHESTRGFITYTGVKNGKKITIMSIGMGLAMMDFAVREVRAVTSGPLAIVRLGSCGTPTQEIPVGAVVVAKTSYAVTTNYNAFSDTQKGLNSAANCYLISNPIDADPILHKLLMDKLSKYSFPLYEGTDATADSFYGSQGRIDGSFDDRNSDLIDNLLTKMPETRTLQMETFHLYHLARLNKHANAGVAQIKCAASAIVVAQRQSNAFLANDKKYVIEREAGVASLEALLEYEL